ncbi:MAG: MarR family transcriptional regulator [Chloroflexota bacterium]|nr:MarR family transcriptional regulator [Chloroflexota bacterium]
MSSRRLALVTKIKQAMQDQQGQSAILSDAIADRLCITPTELECLGTLALGGPLAAGDLAKRTGLTTGAVTRLIDRLESHGIARRRSDPDDRRRVLVEITPLAHKTAAPFYGPIERESAQLLAGYGEKELELILDFARKSYEFAKRHTERVEDMPRRPQLPKRTVSVKGRVLGQTVKIKF